MNTVLEYINSGILEMYLLGMTTSAESAEVLEMSKKHPEILTELEEISKTLELDSIESTPDLSPTIKPFLLAVIDYTERLKNGEETTYPPILNSKSKASDFSSWINRTDMVLPEDFDSFHAKIIGFTPEATTAITWIQHMAPDETHDDEFERFLILEGSCDVTFDNKIHKLVAGDFLEIPLHTPHELRITSNIPCKVILQRVAA